MAEDKTKNEEEQTLSDEEIQSESAMGRRSLLSMIGTGVVGGAAVVASGCIVRTPAPAVTVRTTRARTGVTDSDTGSYADPAGNGRGGVRVRARTGITDSDSGSYADPAGNGRGRTGLTDSDTGRYADPAGRGRRGYKE